MREPSVDQSKSCHVVIGRRQFARLAFAVRVLLDREHVQPRHLEVFIDPAKVVLAFVVLLFLFSLWIVIVKAIERPSGDHSKFDTALLASVSGSASPPFKLRR